MKKYKNVFKIMYSYVFNGQMCIIGLRHTLYDRCMNYCNIRFIEGKLAKRFDRK